MDRYEDIINLPHHRSEIHPPMPVENRAAQFAPFAALTGHEDAIAETARITEKMTELSEEAKREIAGTIMISYEKCLPVRLTYFRQDPRKEGGTYLQTTGIVAKIDEFEKTIQLASGIKLRLEDISSAILPG